MAKQPAIGTPAPVLAVVNGVPTTTSLDVALHFGKRHDNVVRAIESLLPQLPPVTRLNFEASDYTDATGRALPMYRLTRDGFTLLAMGFTGARALEFKLDYLDAFNRMEAELARQAQALAARAGARALPKPAIRSREDLSFARYDKDGHWRNWSVEPRCRQWEDGIERGEAFFREVAELAAHDEDEAYDALRFVFGRGWASSTNGSSQWSTGHPGEETGFAAALARAALDGLRARRGGAEPFDPDRKQKPGRPRKGGSKRGALGPSSATFH